MNKWLKLALMAGQVSAGALHVVLVHRSKRVEENGDSSYQYSATVAVLLAELLKFSVCIFALSSSLAAREVRTPESPSGRGGAGASWRGLRSLAWLEEFQWRSYPKFAVPAAIYQLENNIRFVVLRELKSPVTLVVFSHLEIPIVALMSSSFLKRKLTRIQWVSILLLVNGVMASQLAVCESQLKAPCSHFRDYPLYPLSLVLLAALLAAAAGIGTEHLFQSDFESSIFLQNAQLYSFGILLNAAVLLLREPERLAPSAMLTGFNATAVAAIVAMAVNGLCVSAVIKHMSNIAKVYASACGLFITAGMAALVSEFDLSLPFILSAFEVVCASFLYHVEKKPEGHAADLMMAPSQPPAIKNPISPVPVNADVAEEELVQLLVGRGLERRHSPDVLK